MLSVRYVLIGLGLVAMAGCEGMLSREDDPMYLKMNELDSRLTRVERLVDNEGLANLMAQLNAMQKDVQALRNDVETLQYQTGQSNERQKDLYLDIDQRLQALEQANANLDVFEGGSLSPGQLPVPGGTDRANYQAAFELLKQGRYDQAAIALQQFMVAFPGSELSDNAQYWLAETYYVTQKYKQALPAFQAVLDRYPDSRKIPDALLKIGYCNYELKRVDAAQKALQAVAADYPETTAARLASQRLERISSEQR
ncbi:MAG: tol-pal system protein YbgF [Gammaproteobacteria bacterium]|nr:tol-pal system protein YbgF [Gammaproteobacteria bacterium]NND36327.1 tol-pal system protein YbgF [Gammaproteobacteria bacterium]